MKIEFETSELPALISQLKTLGLAVTEVIEQDNSRTYDFELVKENARNKHALEFHDLKTSNSYLSDEVAQLRNKLAALELSHPCSQDQTIAELKVLIPAALTNNKLAAIKAVKTLTGLGLKDSKDLILDLLDRKGV